MRANRFFWVPLALLTSCAAGLESWDDDDESYDYGKADWAQRDYRVCDPIRGGKYAVKGDIVTPAGVVEGGFLVVDGELIAEIRAAADGLPSDVTLVADTRGIVFPGLIDGHNHVEYNHIPVADLGRRFKNRYQWPRERRYQQLVKEPFHAVKNADLTCEGVKHGEVRALVGGTTAIQGTPDKKCIRHLVRNLEQPNFCERRVRQSVFGVADFARRRGDKPSFAESVLKQLSEGELDAVIFHVAEGIDDTSRKEWEAVKEIGFDLPQAGMIHATAFGERELAEAGQAGAKIIWSPLSNLLLYGKTTNIPAALEAGILVSVGSDWAPSGSANVLGELKVADRVNRVLWDGRISDEDLFKMVTINPARTFGMDKDIGSLEVGKTADFMVIRKPRETPTSVYRALIDAPPQDVLLVAIAGDPLYGAADHLDQLGKQGDYETIDACGEIRGLDVTVATGVPLGHQSVADIESRLKEVSERLTPLVDCTNDEALMAYKGTPLEE